MLDLSKTPGSTGGPVLNLSKGQTLNLSKNDFVSSGKNVFGMGWRGLNGRDLDLDTYIAAMDENNKVLSFVYFGKKSAPGIKHNGDDLVGGGSGKTPNETIEIDFSKLDSRAVRLIAGMFIYSGASNLSQVDYAFTTLVDSRGNDVMNFDIRESFGKSVSVEVAEMRKRDGEWTLKATGKPSEDDYGTISRRFTVGSIEGRSSSSNSFTTQPQTTQNNNSNNSQNQNQNQNPSSNDGGGIFGALKRLFS